MNAGNPFIYLVLLSAGLSIFMYIRMIIFLQGQGVKISLLKFRLMFPYLSRYRELHAQEKEGGINLFTPWLVSINATFLFAVPLVLTV